MKTLLKDWRQKPHTFPPAAYMPEPQDAMLAFKGSLHVNPSPFSPADAASEPLWTLRILADDMGLTS